MDVNEGVRKRYVEEKEKENFAGENDGCEGWKKKGVVGK